MSPNPRRVARIGRVVVWVGCLAPLAWIIGRIVRDDLGANPIEELTHWSGDWTLNLLLVTLAVTPLRRITGWNGIIRFRRPIGLFAAFYAALHLLVYICLDRFFAFDTVIADVMDRPYITAGFAGLVLLVPLAATSTKGWVRRLGKWWRRLHRLVYAAAALGVLHYLWLVKADTRVPLRYAVVLAVLLSFRLRPVRWVRRLRSGPQRTRRAATVRAGGRGDVAPSESAGADPSSGTGGLPHRPDRPRARGDAIGGD
ncbi:MAG TPA: protein-methionine-sulfoxide reductase heme-binding subunit MsrQ [Longimicrobiales bacterium]